MRFISEKWMNLRDRFGESKIVQQVKECGPVAVSYIARAQARLMRLCEREHAVRGSLPEGGLFQRFKFRAFLAQGNRKWRGTYSERSSRPTSESSHRLPTNYGTLIFTIYLCVVLKLNAWNMQFSYNNDNYQL